MFSIGQARDWADFFGRGLHALVVIVLPVVLPAMLLLRSTREEIYNILWALVFGFATLNILSLGARRFEQEKTGLNFGEILAVLVVLLSIVLLGWELLYEFHILPIRLTPR
jgi:lipopolysaccharide export LptBFGC system permease protein LptF